MTGAELKEALLQRCPVVCSGIRYAYISAIIYRAKGDRIAVTAELMDVNAHSVTVAEAGKITKERTDENDVMRDEQAH